MQEINLLQNRIKDRTDVWSRRSLVIRTFLSLFLVLELAVFGGLLLLTKSNQTGIQQTEAEITAIQSEIDQQRGELVSAQAFQAQLKNIRTLLDGHLYWSAFFDELSRVTFQRAQYMTLSATAAGKLHLEGSSGSYQDIGKLLLGLSTSDNFKDVKLLSVSTASGNVTGNYLFSVDMNVLTDILKK